MSVDIAGNPWKFKQDGIGTNPVGFQYFGYVFFNDFMITETGSSGNRIYITDWSGRSLVDFTADGSNEAFKGARIGKVPGVKIVQFDSGTLIIGV